MSPTPAKIDGSLKLCPPCPTLMRCVVGVLLTVEDVFVVFDVDDRVDDTALVIVDEVAAEVTDCADAERASRKPTETVKNGRIVNALTTILAEGVYKGRLKGLLAQSGSDSQSCITLDGKLRIMLFNRGVEE